MKKWNKFLFGLIAFMAFHQNAQSDDKKPTNKPNVIIIITDDQGYGDIAAHGNKIIKTPAMDRLRNQGVAFDNFHAGSTCAPSRSALMTGMEGHRAGVWHTIAGCNLLREKFTAMPQVFQDNGYATALFGKWHLGDAYPYLPENRGFETALYHSAGGIGQTPDFWDNDYFDDVYLRNGKPEQFEGYCTDVFFDEAMKYIEEKKDQPFFLYLSTNAPHGPLNVPEEYYNLYKDEEELLDFQKAYYGMITNIDDNITRLEKKLKELKLIDNTILIFTTDNGSQYGWRNIKGKEYGFNANMRGLKSSQYDGGHRVPFFMYWKNGKLKKGKSIDQLVMSYDVLPTLIDLCDLEQPKETQYDGKTVSPLIFGEGKNWPNRYAVLDKNKTQHPVKWKLSAVMDNDWRLINGKELYNIREDVGQENDIASSHPEKVKEMRNAYEKWWEHVSKDFSKFEYYKVGVDGIDETALTVHDIHSDKPLAWNQDLIRDPLSGKKPALTDDGFWTIDIQQEGYYTVTLARWPKEADLQFDSKVEALGITKPWYIARPEGRVIPLKKAMLEIDALRVYQDVDMSSKGTSFRVYLNEGKARLVGKFTDEDNKDISAFYVYISKEK
ncbi:arylsulfatase [Flammeovirga agarivorans]|uniref:Arylsulfatase n=1 Tax=Flammeovirga agarivorans TaxID=2726742 RepID=A0A7X8SKI0_9BACT|nr:arylsulfatase [Flammeovirga agarivorans]NLR91827.1 arylsulfatase [Flammeovirga agarivorans]